MPSFKDPRFKRGKDLVRSESLSDLTLVCQVRIKLQATFDEILTDGLCLIGRSRVRPPGSPGQSQSLAQRYLPLVVSTEEHQPSRGPWPSLQVQGKNIILLI